MKKTVLILIAFLSVIVTKAQLTTESGNLTYTFKPKGSGYINLRGLKDSTYNFLSKDGVRMILAIRNKRIVNTKIFNAAGKEIDINPSTARGEMCTICHMERVDGPAKGGVYRRVCVTGWCHDVESINKGLATQ